MISARIEIKSCGLCAASLILLAGCHVQNYPPSFVQSPATWHRIELQASSVSDDAELKGEITGLLADGWDAESGWTIDNSAASNDYIQTEWRYGYSCYRFGDYRRRILVRLASDETPPALYVKTESARKDREREFLWWGGQERGWIEGYDPEFQATVSREIEHRIRLWSDAMYSAPARVQM